MSQTFDWKKDILANLVFPSRIVLAQDGDGLTGPDGAFLGPGPSHVAPGFSTTHGPGGMRAIETWNRPKQIDT